VRSHLLEFIDDGGHVRTPGDLRDGESYGVVLTTGGGLYRYRLGDRVRVDGFAERTPCLTFVGREDQVSDLRGEKLNGAFVAGVLEALFGAEAPGFAMLAPDAASGPLRYTLYVAGATPPPAGLAARLDALLGANPQYRYCRRIGQLGRPAVFRVEAGGHVSFIERASARGGRAGAVKPPSLSSDDGWSRRLVGTYVE
jgi:hypothetical protein